MSTKKDTHLLLLFPGVRPVGVPEGIGPKVKNNLFIYRRVSIRSHVGLMLGFLKVKSVRSDDR